PDALGMTMREGHGDEGAHRVPDDGRGLDTHRVQHRVQVVSVHGHSRRSRDAIAGAAAAQVRRDDADAGQPLDDERPGQMRGGDPVDQERRAHRLAIRLPERHPQVASGDGHVGRAVSVGRQRALHPPSIVYEAPVTMPAASEASHPASEATSLGSTRRLTALSVSMIRSTTSPSGMPCTRAWSAICFSTSGVRTYPGLMQLLVTPCGPPSSAVTFDRPSSPCLAATYADLNALARRPCTLETLMMRPQPRSYMPGSAARMSRNGASSMIR